MKSWTKTMAGATLGAALLTGAWAAPANATGNGRADVVHGTTVHLKDAPMDRVTKKLADLCGDSASSYAAKARKADRTGKIVIVCTRDGETVYVRP